MIHNFTPKTPNNFYCEKCDFSSSNKKDYNRHLDTAKHKKIQNDTLLAPTSEKVYTCCCGNTYRHSSNFYRHRKTCKKMGKTNLNNLNDEDSITISKEEYISFLSNTDLIKKIFEQNIEMVQQNINIVNQNKEVVEQNMQLQTTIVEMSKQSGSNNNNNTNTNINTNSFHTNSHNKTAFNLNFFLNETCKNAMNLSEFVDAVIPTLDELETTGRLGNSEGVSKIISTRLRVIEKELRPLHCSDGKREVFYVKENNIWNKEAEEKPLLIKAIKQITQKNIKNIMKWRDEHPDCTDSDSSKNDLYLKITLNSMPGGTAEETERNIENIISNIAKYTQIERN